MTIARSLLVVAAFVAGCSSSSSSTGPADAGHDATQPDGGEAGVDAGPAEGVLQHHNDGMRSGFYVDPAFTKAALTGIEPLPGFSATIETNVFAEPLFVQGGVGGQDALFVVTETNNVYALQADTGATLWKVSLGTPEPSSALPSLNNFRCGTIAPLGITSTPIIDPASRSLFVAAMTMNNGVPDYQVSALSLEDGSTSWTVDLNAKLAGFASLPLMQRGALALLNGILYIPFGGQAGGCVPFNGWVVGVPLANPQAPSGWHTGSSGGGIWAPSGAATDGTSVYVSTASPDTDGLSPIWSQNNTEAILRIGAGATFSGASTDYFVPKDWFDYGIAGSQLGAAGVILLDSPASTPSELAFAIGKTSDGYLVDRTNLGGIGSGVAQLASATSNWVEGAMATYSTGVGQYIAFTAPGSFCPANTDLSTLKVVAGSPPTLVPGWCAVQGGAGSPIATASAAATGNVTAKDVVVWGLGTGNQGTAGTGKLSAFDGDTGALLAQASTTMSNVQHWISPIVAKGRLYIAGNAHVYAFDLAGPRHAPPPRADAGADAGGPPASCLLTITPDQTDACAAYGLSCQGTSVYGTCMPPTEGLPCLPQVGCASGLSCVKVAGNATTTCQEPCGTTADCTNPFDSCGTAGGDGGTCLGASCGPSVDAGSYYAPCTTGTEGTCVPFFNASGSSSGMCLATGDAGATGCGLNRGSGLLCPEGSFCYTGTSNSACLPLCDFTHAAFGVDGGGPSCGPNAACMSLGPNVRFGACATACGGDAGTTCSAPLTCQVWNGVTNQSACLP